MCTFCGVAECYMYGVCTVWRVVIMSYLFCVYYVVGGSIS